MRIECPQCSEWVPARIEELGSRAVHFRCGACDARIEVLADSEPSGQESLPPEPQEGLACPKCKALVDSGASACKACGLAAERFASFESSPGPSVGADELDQAWSRLVENWDDETLHEAFLEEVAALGSYDQGAIRYRAAAALPAQNAQATLMLARIRSMAAAALLTSRPKVAKTEEPFRAVLMLLIALVIIAGAGGFYVIMKTKERPAERKIPQFRTVAPSHGGGR